MYRKNKREAPAGILSTIGDSTISNFEYIKIEISHAGVMIIALENQFREPPRKPVVHVYAFSVSSGKFRACVAPLERNARFSMSRGTSGGQAEGGIEIPN